MRVLLLAPYYDKNVPGESWCTFKWVEKISERCEVTVLTSHIAGWEETASPTQAKKVINWTHPVLKGKLARMGYELKPHYLFFYRRARRWLKEQIAAGFSFDLVHQINPVAIRYPSPARNLGLDYLTGPHAGSLETPQGFRDECEDRQLYRRLRKMDRWRIKNDPTMRSSLTDARIVLGVAPYLQEQLFSEIDLQRYEIMAETGPELLQTGSKKVSPSHKPLRLVFVGRIIRTKGVLDAVRAVALASSKCEITLDVLGEGEMLECCQAEARKLGVAHLITFHGRVSRSEVYEFYRRSDVFLFPSFREPSGTVVFEALGFALPLITSNVGGPGYVINDSCGIRVEPSSPEKFAAGLAKGIVSLAQDRARLQRMSEQALVRVKEVACWDGRSDRLMELYQDVLSSQPACCE